VSAKLIFRSTENADHTFDLAAQRMRTSTSFSKTYTLFGVFYTQNEPRILYHIYFSVLRGNPRAMATHVTGIDSPSGIAAKDSIHSHRAFVLKTLQHTTHRFPGAAYISRKLSGTQRCLAQLAHFRQSHRYCFRAWTELFSSRDFRALESSTTVARQ
jgi:hypothetical protein